MTYLKVETAFYGVQKNGKQPEFPLQSSFVKESAQEVLHYLIEQQVPIAQYKSIQPNFAKANVIEKQTFLTQMRILDQKNPQGTIITSSMEDIDFSIMKNKDPLDKQNYMINLVKKHLCHEYSTTHLDNLEFIETYNVLKEQPESKEMNDIIEFGKALFGSFNLEQLTTYVDKVNYGNYTIQHSVAE